MLLLHNLYRGCKRRRFAGTAQQTNLVFLASNLTQAPTDPFIIFIEAPLWGRHNSSLLRRESAWQRLDVRRLEHRQFPLLHREHNHSVHKRPNVGSSRLRWRRLTIPQKISLSQPSVTFWKLDPSHVAPSLIHDGAGLWWWTGFMKWTIFGSPLSLQMHMLCNHPQCSHSCFRCGKSCLISALCLIQTVHWENVFSLQYLRPYLFSYI